MLSAAQEPNNHAGTSSPCIHCRRTCCALGARSLPSRHWRSPAGLPEQGLHSLCGCSSPWPPPPHLLSHVPHALAHALLVLQASIVGGSMCMHACSKGDACGCSKHAAQRMLVLAGKGGAHACRCRRAATLAAAVPAADAADAARPRYTSGACPTSPERCSKAHGTHWQTRGYPPDLPPSQPTAAGRGEPVHPTPAVLRDSACLHDPSDTGTAQRDWVQAPGARSASDGDGGERHAAAAIPPRCKCSATLRLVHLASLTPLATHNALQ